jgi:hypothetical protein
MIVVRDRATTSLPGISVDFFITRLAGLLRKNDYLAVIILHLDSICTVVAHIGSPVEQNRLAQCLRVDTSRSDRAGVFDSRTM